MIELPNVKSITPVGSRVTCNPAPTDTDKDWLVLVDKAEEFKLWEWLSNSQWEIGGSLPDDMKQYINPDDVFYSFTLGVDNIIMTTSAVFHKRFLAATSIAKHLNLLSKNDRIALFQAVLYGNAYEPITAPEDFFA